MNSHSLDNSDIKTFKVSSCQLYPAVILGLWRWALHYVLWTLPSFYLSDKLSTNHNRLAPAQGLTEGTPSEERSLFDCFSQ